MQMFFRQTNFMINYEYIYVVSVMLKFADSAIFVLRYYYIYYSTKPKYFWIFHRYFSWNSNFMVKRGEYYETLSKKQACVVFLFGFCFIFVFYFISFFWLFLSCFVLCFLFFLSPFHYHFSSNTVTTFYDCFYNSILSSLRIFSVSLFFCLIINSVH